MFTYVSCKSTYVCRSVEMASTMHNEASTPEGETLRSHCSLTSVGEAVKRQDSTYVMPPFWNAARRNLHKMAKNNVAELVYATHVCTVGIDVASKHTTKYVYPLQTMKRTWKIILTVPYLTNPTFVAKGQPLRGSEKLGQLVVNLDK